MRKVLSVMACFAFFAVSALAESFSGKLIDSSCYDQKKSSTGCDAKSTTTSFALDVSGKVYKLDAAGNTKAATAVKNRADRSDPAKPAASTIMATVTGTDRGGTISVDSIDVQ